MWFEGRVTFHLHFRAPGVSDEDKLPFSGFFALCLLALDAAGYDLSSTSTTVTSKP